MGVLGLTPFLQKNYPEVIKRLPDRLRSFRGKTIVIDGTLITQRLHFASMPWDHRHVLGWYKILQELKDSGVSAICVFDGQERNQAKAREAARRKEVRNLAVARGSIEVERLKRLRKLIGLVEECAQRKERERGGAVSALRGIVLGGRKGDAGVGGGEPVPPPESTPPPPEFQILGDIPSAFTSLYFEYCQSIPKLTSLSPKSPSPSSPTPAAQDEQESTIDQEQEQAEYAMSKQQLQLMVDEGKVWDDLIADQPKSRLRIVSAEPKKEIKPMVKLFPPRIDVAKATLISLAEKSSLISESYERRNNPPTAQTFEESKEIIRALGVPCLDSAGAYEAEALAASLVINGHADYVASEDTDVLVYEAPLIRNITSRAEPLTIVSGSNIRTVLDLSRASFIDFALLLGTDFSQRIKNIGPQRALKLIHLYGSIEAIIQQERKYSPRLPEKAYLEQVEVARGVFRTLPEVPDLSLLKARESDTEAVGEILQKYGLHRASGYEWDYDAALEGNYFEDNPSAR